MLQGSRDCPRTDGAVPQFGHLSLSLIAVVMSERSKLLPVRDAMTVTRWAIGLSSNITSVCFAFEPMVNSSPTDIEVLAGFASEHSI